ncbi:MAG TPA: DUF3093 domain-containing protein [Actinomycetes bacterium]|nr:DUF3093 domain-containing protein [Actinomycetes bacterium]
MTTYEERLTAPAGLYVLAWVMAFALGLSFFAALGPVAGLLALGVPGVLATVVLTRAAAVVRVDDGHLTAGEARIPVGALGPVRVLDPEQARQVRGPASDPAGYHLIRGWVPAGVQAEVVDPADPTPYWFVATRHPQRLADAVEAARTIPGP